MVVTGRWAATRQRDGTAGARMSAGRMAGARTAGRPGQPGTGRGARTGRSLWWVSPVGAVMLVVPGTLLLSVRLSDLDFRLFYRVPKAITGSQSALLLAAAGLLALGALLPATFAAPRWPRPWPALTPAQLRVLGRSATVCFRLTTVGYAALGLAGVARGARPAALLEAVQSQSNYSGTLKSEFAPVTGITTLTQVGIAFVVIAALLLPYDRSRRLRRQMLIVVLLGLLRSYLLTERLALLELLVPLIAVRAVQLRQASRRVWLLPAAPAMAVPLLLVVFGAFEYSRSWVFFRTRTQQGFPSFVVNRLAGYYATAYNNGALQLQYGDRRGRLPYDSLAALWTAPGASQLHLYNRLSGTSGGTLLATVLNQHGNPEFNNPGGLAVPLIDFGTTGGLLFFLVAGLAIGLAYRGFRSGQPLGLLLYPVAFTGLLELPRYVYWTQGRVTPAVVALVVIGLRVRAVGRPARRPRAAPPAAPGPQYAGESESTLPSTAPTAAVAAAGR